MSQLSRTRWSVSFTSAKEHAVIQLGKSSINDHYKANFELYNSSSTSYKWPPPLWAYYFQLQTSGVTLDSNKVRHDVIITVYFLQLRNEEMWCLLSLVVAGMASFAFLQPSWLMETLGPHSLGIHSFCVRDLGSPAPHAQLCGLYGGSLALANIPSLEWRLSCVLFGGGCALHLFCAVLGIATLCLRKVSRSRLACSLGFVQAVAVIFSVVGLLFFPMGFNSKFVHHYCGADSHRFNAGKCEAGWGLLLAAMGTALSIFCPILAQFFDIHVCDKPYFNNESLYKLELNNLAKHLENCEERECQNYAEMYIIDREQCLLSESDQLHRQTLNSPFLSVTDTFSSSTGHSVPSFK